MKETSTTGTPKVSPPSSSLVTTNTETSPSLLTASTLKRLANGEKRLTRNRGMWYEAVMNMYHCGFITEPTEVADCVYTATQTGHGWVAVASEMACGLPGQIWPGKSSVSWVCGAGGPHGRLIDTQDVARMEKAYAVCTALGADCYMPWSMGRIATACMKWAVDPKRCPTNTERLLKDITIGYHDCTPGHYPDHGERFIRDPMKDLFDEGSAHPNPDYRPGATMYDVSGYYYNLLVRARSPRLQVGSRLFWGDLTDREGGRWKDMLVAVASYKTLRNSLVGSAMGAKGKRPVYAQDKAKPGTSKRTMIPLPGGPFRGLGLLIVRTGWELSCIASGEVDSIYGTIDSVTSVGETPPRVWTAYGLKTEIRHQGDTTIHRRGCWKVGPKATIPYISGHTMTVPVARAELPERLYYREWLEE